MSEIEEIDVAATVDELRTLWSEVFGETWPVPTSGMATSYCNVGFGMRDSGKLVAVALGKQRSVRCVMVHPDYRRQGLGTELLERIVPAVSNGDETEVSLGSGGEGSYFWPGVPVDDAAADRFFVANGWLGDNTVIDLGQDLNAYKGRPELRSGAQQADVQFSVLTDESQRRGVIEFEQRHFPHWVQWYLPEAIDFNDILVGRIEDHVVAVVTLEEPTNVWPLAGEKSCAIGAVGVDPALHGRRIGTAIMDVAAEILGNRGARQCHIGWVERVEFYRRLGYLQTRRYRMMKKAV